MQAVYRAGLVFRGDIDLPIIDWRNYLEDELNMHNSQQSFASRKRMLNVDGDANNQVVWFTDVVDPSKIFDQTPEALEVMDEWMANIRANPWNGVAANKPPLATDRCFDDKGVEIAHGAGRVGRHHRRQARRYVHAEVQDIQHVATPRGRAVRAEYFQVPAHVGRRRGRARVLRRMDAGRGGRCEAEGDLPDRGVRLQQAGRGIAGWMVSGDVLR